MPVTPEVFKVGLIAAVIVSAAMAFASPRERPRQSQTHKTHAWLMAEARACFPGMGPWGSAYDHANGYVRRVVNAYIWNVIDATTFVELARGLKVSDTVISCLVLSKRRAA